MKRNMIQIEIIVKSKVKIKFIRVKEKLNLMMTMMIEGDHQGIERVKIMMKKEGDLKVIKNKETLIMMMMTEEGHQRIERVRIMTMIEEDLKVIKNKKMLIMIMMKEEVLLRVKRKGNLIMMMIGRHLQRIRKNQMIIETKIISMHLMMQVKEKVKK